MNSTKGRMPEAAAVKTAAAGRWIDILEAAGIDSTLLDGKGHPCPKCGGSDRFAATKDIAQRGAVICRGCFPKGGGDGLATLAWFKGCDFPEALRWLAEHLNIAPTGNGQPTGQAHGQRRIVAHYSYRDAAGDLVFQTVRYEPKDFRQRRPQPGGGWIWNLEGIDTVPYRLPELLADPEALVIVCEGEKDCDNLARLGFVTTTNHGGAGKWTAIHAKHLTGRPVVILPDNDDPGKLHVQQVASSLQGIAARVAVLHLPDLPYKGDASDWIEAGGTPEALQALIDAAPEWTPAETGERIDGAPDSDGDDNAPERKSQATLLVELAAAAELWHTAGQGACYATLPVADHRENWPIRSRSFSRQWLARQYFLEYRKTPGGQALADALNTIEGLATFDGPEHPCFVRVAENEGQLFLDLANNTWQAVAIDPDGWKVIESAACPVRFRRAAAMLPLPTPIDGGDIRELQQFVNVADDSWPLLLGWLVASFRPSGPYPILMLLGEQGSAKSTTARVARALIDPNKAPLRSEPREPRDLMIAAENGWVTAYDNLSFLPGWLSDSLCRLSTGGGFATRALYADAEETIFDAMRPVILNGIEEPGTRSDLLDRCVILQLPRIPETQRRTEAEFWKNFKEAHGRLLGSVLSAVSVAMRNLPTTRLAHLPRMADFATWATAAETGFGLQPGGFMAAYASNRDAANETALESSPVAKHILQVAESGDWEGTAGELLEHIEGMASDAEKRGKTWPKNARSLSGQLKRLAPNLRAVGVEIDSGTTGRGKDKRKQWAIRTSRELCDPCAPSDPNTEKTGFCGGANGQRGRNGGATGAQTLFDVTPYGATVGAQTDVGGAKKHTDSKRARVTI
jgi:hypothetical protein